MKIVKKISSILVAMSLLLGSNSFAADKFPSKYVEMTVLFGGTAKSVGQLVAKGLEKNLGANVVPVSRTGGGGAVGYKYIQSRPATGYDIVWNSNSVSTSHYKGRTSFKSFQVFGSFPNIVASSCASKIWPNPTL